MPGRPSSPDERDGPSGSGDARLRPEDVTVALIAAVAENGVIGREGEMPWHYPADLEHFRNTTMDHPVVLGRRTYETIVDRLGEPLPGRTSVVLTNREPELPERAVAVGSVEAALDAAREALAERHSDADGTVYVAGGGSVYEQFLPLSDRLALTEVHDTVEGDTTFPDVDWERWREVERDDREDLSFVTYERRP